MKEGTKIIYEGGQGEIEEKKSRFIGQVFSVTTEEEALGIIEQVKKKYWDARHHCYAYIMEGGVLEDGTVTSDICRFSDDGEPGGTAGKPMLEVLLGENLVNVLVVVTRYFGGTLLGTGGLVRAYQQATKEGLLNSRIASRKEGVRMDVTTDYNGLGKLQYLIGSSGERAFILDVEYTDNVVMHLLSCKDYGEELKKDITEATLGKAEIKTSEETVKFLRMDGNTIFVS